MSQKLTNKTLLHFTTLKPVRPRRSTPPTPNCGAIGRNGFWETVTLDQEGATVIGGEGNMEF
jgi:hypothetical protein